MKKTSCVGKCKLDKNRNYCTGCLRTNKDLREWYFLSPSEQQQMLDDYNKESNNIGQ